MSRGLPPNRRLRVGVQLWAAGALLFALMAAGAALFDRFPGDERIAHALQGIDVPGFAGFVDAINWLGNTWPSAALIILVAAALTLRRGPLEAGIVLLTFAAKGLNSLLQELIDRPRPSPELVEVTKHVEAGGFPSGHTVGTTVLFGLLFLQATALVPWPALRWALRAGCLLVMVAAGPARVYIGVHWPSDVFGGYLLAALFLAPLFVLYVELRRRGNVDSWA